MSNSEYIINFLKEHNIAYQCYSHQPIYTLEDGLEIAKQTGIKPCKCLLLVNRQFQHYMLLAQGNEYINLHYVADLIHSSHLSFASTETLETLLHTTSGAVSPLGLIFDITGRVGLIIDERILQFRELMLAPCVNDKSIIMKTQDFISVFLPASKHPNFQIIKTETRE